MNYDTEIIEKVCSNFELYVSVEVKPSQTKIELSLSIGLQTQLSRQGHH